MFELSFAEVAVVALVALIVLGPQRLPGAARTVGALLRRARNAATSLKADIERELAADELKRSLHDTGAAVQSTRDAVADAARDTARLAAPDAGAPATPAAPSDDATPPRAAP